MISLSHLFEYLSYTALVSIVIFGVVLIRKKRSSSLPMVPYDLPWFGSAMAISKMGMYAWIRSNLHLGPIFQATIAGRPTIFVTDYVAARQILNANDNDISPRPLGEAVFLRMCAVKPSDAKLLFGNPNSSIFQKHLIPEDALSTLLLNMQTVLKQMMPSAGDSWMRCDLNQVFGRILMRATISELVDIPGLESDELLDCMQLFLERMDEVAFTSPSLQRYTCSEVYNAREKIVSHIKDHLMQEISISPLGPDAMSKGRLRRSRIAFQKSIGISVDGLARCVLFLLFVSMTNSIPSVISIISQLLKNSTAYHEIYDEVEKIAQCKESFSSPFTLNELKAMVKLDSIFYETMRLEITNAYWERSIERDLDIKLALSNGKKLAFFATRGSRVITCPPIMNRDDEVFKNAEDFLWDRFLPRNGENGAMLSNRVEVFGGGLHLCPGRKLARALDKALVAMIILQFDLRFADGIIPSKTDATKSVSFSFNRSQKMDVQIDIRRRHL